MSRIAIVGTLLALSAIARAGDDPPERPPVGPFKIACWYEAGRPVESLQYRVYDLGKREFDEPAVDRWLDEILAKYRGHGAYVRDLPTAGEPGATEGERLKAAIDREKRRWAELQRRPTPPSPFRVALPRSNPYPSGRPKVVGLDRPDPGSTGPAPNLPSSPFPYPYINRVH